MAALGAQFGVLARFWGCFFLMGGGEERREKPKGQSQSQDWLAAVAFTK